LDELGTEGKNCDLFIGLWSISETPLEFRRQALAAVEPAANFLIASQRQFADVDNGPFFDQWTAEHPQLKWTELPIPYLDARYLIGTAIAAH
jgi:hypothetical protein